MPNFNSNPTTVLKRIALVCTLVVATGPRLVTPAIASDPAQQSAGKAMQMDEPMPTKMKKPGMKKGDVKQAGEKKKKEMQPMLDKERQAMPQGAGKP